MPQPVISVPLPLPTFLSLVDFLRDHGSDRDPVAMVEKAIRFWLENAEWKLDDLLPEIRHPARHHGYRWKEILLPPGTKIRTEYKKKAFHAEIIDGDFIYNDKKTSPSDFANMVSGNTGIHRTTRNAWKVLYVKRPADDGFVLADRLRHERKHDDDQRTPSSEITLASLGLADASDSK